MKTVTSKLFQRGKQLFLLALVVILISGQAGWVSAQAPGPQGQGEPVYYSIYSAVTRSNDGEPMPPPFVTMAAGTQVSINPVDALLVREQPAVNDAFGGGLWAGLYQIQENGPILTGRSVLQFPLDIIPPNATITKAELKLALCGWYDVPGATREVNIYRVRNLWHQSLVSWATMPVLGEKVGSVMAGMPALPYTYTIDLTNLAKGWYSGSFANDGILLSGNETLGFGGRVFCSNDTTYPPALQVTFTPAPPTLNTAQKEIGILTDKPEVLTAPKLIEIENKGSSPLAWQLTTSGLDWMTIDRTSGSIGPDMVEKVTVAVKSGIFTPGMKKTGEIQVVSSTGGVSGSPQVIPVSVEMMDKVYNLFLPAAANPSPAKSSLRSSMVTEKKTVALVIGVSDYLYLTPPSQISKIRWNYWGFDTLETRNTKSNTQKLLASVFKPTAPKSDVCTQSTCMIQTVGNLSIIALNESQASFEGIQEAMKTVDALEDENSRVMIFYAGHGGHIPDTNGDEADGQEELLTAWDTDDAGGVFTNYISDDQLKQWVAAFESQEIGIFIDACNSGGFDDLQGPGRILLLSSRETENSTEVSSLHSSTFMYYFFQALMDSTADSNHDGWVSAQEAFPYLAPKVTLEYASQHPVMFNGLGSIQFPITDLAKIYLPDN